MAPRPPPAKPHRSPVRPLLVALAGLYLIYATGMGGQLSIAQAWSGAPKSKKRQLLEAEVVDASLAAADVEYAITQPAAVQGFVRKAGPTMLRFWTAGNRTDRHGEFSRWMQATNADRESELAAEVHDGMRLAHLPPLYPNCQVLVNHRYKFIYVRHPKSASSSLMVYFTTCPANTHSGDISKPGGGGSSSGGGGEGGAAEGEGEKARSWDSYSLGAACLEPMSTLELAPEEVARIWSEYFVFTVVRNPYQRMLSSYKYLLRKTRANPRCKMVRWDDFCEDPLSLGRMCASNHECCPLPAGFYWHHIIDQGRCLETEEGGWAVDYVATVEHFGEQVQEIIAEIDRRRPEGLPPLRKVTGQLQQQNEARGPGSCRQEEQDLEHMEPEKTRVLVGDTWIPYNATVLLDRYCDAADYFRGPHEHCLLRGRHFYASDFQRLYGRRKGG